jgi:hypothetical protein
MTSYTFTARDNSTSLAWGEHTGTLTGAIRKARKYAREALPAWGYKGYGPLVIVRDSATGETLHEERL